MLRGSPPASSPAGTGRRSGLWDSRDRRTRRRSRPKVAATSAAPISGTCILRGGARWLLPRSPMWGGAKRLPWFPAEFGGTVHAPLIGGACLLEGGGAFWQPGAPQGFRIPRAASLTQLPSYQKWKQKQKIDDRDSEEEGSSHRRGPEGRGGKRGRGQGRLLPQMQVGKWCVRSPGTWSSDLPAAACSPCPQRGPAARPGSREAAGCLVPTTSDML